MIGEQDAPYTYEYSDYYKIVPNIFDWANDPERIKDGKKVSTEFVYSSESNTDWMSVETLRNWIKKNFDDIGFI